MQVCVKVLDKVTIKKMSEKILCARNSYLQAILNASKNRMATVTEISWTNERFRSYRHQMAFFKFERINEWLIYKHIDNLE